MLAWFDAIAIGHVIGASTIVALFSMFFQTADNDQLLDGNAKLATTDAAAEVVGPALAGLAIQLVTAPFAILFDALSYLWSAVLLSSIKRPEVPARTGEHAPDLWRETKEGLSFVFGHSVLRPLTLCLATLSFCLSFFAPLYVLYAVRDLAIPPGVLGFIIALGGVSAVIGARLVGWAGRRFAPRRLLIGILVAYSMMIAFIPLAHGPLWMAVVFLCVSQLFGDALSVIFFTTVATVRQKETPDPLRGREGGVFHLLTAGLGLIGALVAGTAADVAGIRPILLVGALGAFASVLWLLPMPDDP